MHASDDFDPGYDFEITKTTRRAAGAGTWVIGRIDGYRFDALVFPEHAECPEWELGESRISKLWLQRTVDRATVFNWDRGADIAAASDEVQALVDFLAAGLADHIYALEAAKKPFEMEVTFDECVTWWLR